uniref:ATP-dependent zinc metalloprotease FtsH n=1 Tax=Lambia antarctica TaxID=101717 RepID=A0A1L2EDR1_9CHLO|nr:ATP-dependent zinc metalloprotease FtsH [Lambia antarctica]ANN39009.1 ATP-dependent zinc metalloprotease FtsH [Lambia antarctica]
MKLKKIKLQKNINNTKTNVLKTYFWFRSAQKIFKKQLVLIETETHNFYLLFSFLLIIFGVFDILLNPITGSSEKKIIQQQSSIQFYNSTKIKNFKVINIARIYKDSQSFIILNYYSKKAFFAKKSKVNYLPSKIQLAKENWKTKKLPIIHKKSNLLKFKIDPLNIFLDLKLNSSKKDALFLFVKENSRWKKKRYSRKLKKIVPLQSSNYFFPTYNSSIYNSNTQTFHINQTPLKNSPFLKKFIHQTSVNKSDIFLLNIPSLYLMDPFHFVSFFSDFQTLPTSIKLYSMNRGGLNKTKATFLNKKPQKRANFSFSTFTKKPNMFKKVYKKSFINDFLYSPTGAFLEKREVINSKSILLFFQLGFLIFFYKIFQNLYKDYGKEILTTFLDFIKAIGVLEDDEWLKDDLNLVKDQKAFRSIKKIKTRLRNIAGIDNLILEISEIIWFLRSQPKTFGAKIFSFSNLKTHFLSKYKNFSNISAPIFLNSKAFLFVGPPGTGKTLLVQAIAGESEVPILIQSGSILKNPRQRGKGARTIQKLFQRARCIAPCIIFIDEVDGIGARREHLSINITGNYDLLEIIDTNSLHFFSGNEKFQQYSEDTFEDSETLDNFDSFNDPQERISLKVLQENEFENISRTEQLSLLTQLLIELDGLKPLNNIVVIGATNRFSVLDPALLRPGRFNNFLYLSLPNEQKRIELFQLYSQRLGFSNEILWPYFSRRTEGLSSADIAAIVNESAIKAISKNQKHTIESLEIGIDRITTTPIRKLFFTINNENKKFLENYDFFYKNFYESWKTQNSHPSGIKNSFEFLGESQNLQLQLKNGYYSISKSLFSVLFKNTPAVCLLSFFTRKANFRYDSANNIVNLLETKLVSRIEIETKLVYLISGKAAELLPNALPLINNMQKSSFKKSTTPSKLMFQLYEQSSFGSHDLKQATLLSKFMINKWYFYAEQIVTEKYHWITRNYNQMELDTDEIRLFKAIAEEMNYQIDQQNNFFDLSQKWSFRSWWQQSIQKKFHFLDRSVLNWYRIYLSDPEESEQNIEWVPPDEFYHTEQMAQINPYYYWNNFLLFTQDYLYHSLILNTFNLSFRTIKNFTELLDLLADSLMRFLKIRDDQLITILKKFLEFQKTSIDDSSMYMDSENGHPLWKTRQLASSQTMMGKETILINNWGEHSRRKKSKKLFLQKLRKLKTN